MIITTPLQVTHIHFLYYPLAVSSYFLYYCFVHREGLSATVPSLSTIYFTADDVSQNDRFKISY